MPPKNLLHLVNIMQEKGFILSRLVSNPLGEGDDI